MIMLTRLGKEFEDGTIMCYFSKPGHVKEYIQLMTIDQLRDRLAEFDATTLALTQMIVK